MGVTVQQVRRLAEAGAISRVARGLIDRHSVDRYLASGCGGRTRVWAEETAWGAIAVLSGQPVDWLTSAQTPPRPRRLLMMHDPRELTTRLRDRATTITYAGDSTAEGVIRERLDDSDGLGPLLVGARPGHLDGYITADQHVRVVRILDLRLDSAGTITLRTTSFDVRRVGHLNEASSVLAAVGAATSTNAHELSGGERLLAQLLPMSSC